MKSLQSILIISAIGLLFSCQRSATKKTESAVTAGVKYAQGFEIQRIEDRIKLIIKSPYPNASEYQEFTFINEQEAKDTGRDLANGAIQRPINRLVVTSTTHIPMLELLGVPDRLVGFPNLKYISSEVMTKRIEAGALVELGKEQSINTEMLLELQPEIVVAFALNGENKALNTIEKAGIPVLLNGDWLEETPLGRAEWIKFFGVLFNKERLADSLFNEIEKEYLQAKELAKNATTRPKVLSGIQFNQVWNVPAGDSFVATFLRDANVDYYWQDSPGKGSLSLNFEAVFEKAQQADIWIDPGQFTSFEQMKEANEHYDKFKAYQNKNVYSYSLKKGPNGGILYYELAAVQPNIVLKDLIKVTHPELLPDYTPFFLQKLND